MINEYQDFYRNSKEFTSIQMAFDKQIKKLSGAIEDVLNQLFVSSATWGLDMWEEMLGLVIAQSKSYEERREIILSRLKTHNITTKQWIKDVALSFNNGDVEIIEDFSNNIVYINFVSELGVPKNSNALKEAIAKIMPAHLEEIFNFKFRTYGEVSHLTWNDVSHLTWDELRSKEGVISDETN